MTARRGRVADPQRCVSPQREDAFDLDQRALGSAAT